jgi:TonB family protein
MYNKIKNIYSSYWYMPVSFLLVLFYSCSHGSSSTTYYPPIVYSRYDLDSKNLLKEYENVPLVRGEDIPNLISKVVEIKDTDRIKNRNVSGTTVLQGIIDEKGEIETIVLIYSINQHYDSLAISAFKNSTFKPLLWNNEVLKYSLIFSYHCDLGFSYPPYVNGISTNFKSKASKVDKKDVYEIFEVTQPPIIIEKTEIVDTIYESFDSFNYHEVIKLEIIINEDGTVENIRIIRSTNPILKKMTLKSVKTYKFKPAILNGEFVKVKLKMTFENTFPGRFFK